MKACVCTPQWPFSSIHTRQTIHTCKTSGKRHKALTKHTRTSRRPEQSSLLNPEGFFDRNRTFSLSAWLCTMPSIAHYPALTPRSRISPAPPSSVSWDATNAVCARRWGRYPGSLRPAVSKPESRQIFNFVRIDKMRFDYGL